jgi:hypothetical protein
MRFLLLAAIAIAACAPEEPAPATATADEQSNASIDRYLEWSKECREGNAHSCGLTGDYLTRARETLGHGRGDQQGAHDAYDKGCRLGDAHSCDALGTGARTAAPTNESGSTDDALASLDPTIPETCQKYARKACRGQSATCRVIVQNANEAGHKPDAKTRCAAAWDHEMRRVVTAP